VGVLEKIGARFPRETVGVIGGSHGGRLGRLDEGELRDPRRALRSSVDHGDGAAGREMLTADIAKRDRPTERDRAHGGGDPPDVSVLGDHGTACGGDAVALEDEATERPVDMPRYFTRATTSCPI